VVSSTPRATPLSPTRLPTLDGWRAVAILAVISSHIAWRVPWIESITQWGPLGVHLFFALSGFLITLRLIEENHWTGRIDWANFY
jgi:peptidoglycan/LPS O-acetylase OafA/YrhL